MMPVDRRDAERTAVGEAEEAAFGGTDAETEQPWATLVEQAAALTCSAWWASAGGPPVAVAPSRTTARSSRARSRSGDPVVAVSLAAGQRDLATLAHELAHALAGVSHGHRARFRTAEIDVVAMMVGPEAARSLAEAFDAFGLVRAERPWPPPWRLDGEGFRVLAPGPGIATA